MPVTESRLRRRVATALATTVVVAAVSASAQTLPRLDGPLTLDRAVDLALAQSLRVRAAGADSRTMDSMRREAQAPLWPQLSANGYLVNQRMGSERLHVGRLDDGAQLPGVQRRPVTRRQRDLHVSDLRGRA